MTGAPPPGPVSATLTFQHANPIRLDVSEIEFIEAWQQPGTRPDIGHLHENNPTSIARAWVRDRLQRAPRSLPSSPVLRVILREGSVTEEALPVEEGLGGLIKNEPEILLSAVLAVEVELTERTGNRIAGITVRVTGEKQILENASLNDRDRTYFALMEQLAAALDKELDNGIRAEMGFLVR